MYRLRGTDAGFLYAESATQPSTSVHLVDLGRPAAGRPPVDLDTLRGWMEQRIDLVPAYRWRLAGVPFGLGHPVAYDDPDLDVGAHVRTARLEPPGDDDALNRLVAPMFRSLDRRRPFWRVTLVDGFADGHQVLVWQFHHVFWDGAAWRACFGRLFSSPGAREGAPLPRDAGPPTRRWLLGQAAARFGRGLAGFPRLLRASMAASKARQDRRSRAGVRVPDKDDTPWCVLNDSFDDARAYRRVTVPVAGVTRVRGATGASFNDVILATVSGALRDHLAATGDLPARPLTAMVPITTEPPGAPERAEGNWVANFLCGLATDVDDPRARLDEISAGTREAYAQCLAGRPELTEHWLALAVPAVAEPAMRAWARRRRAKPDRPEMNVVVSNVRGPDGPCLLAGHPVDNMVTCGHLFDGVGLNFTVTSFGDHLTFAMDSNPSAVPDPDGLAVAVRRSFDTLVGLADPVGRAG